MLQRLVGYLGRNVIGLLALFVALGGTAYAVNAVNSSDIVDGQVKSVDVGDGEILSADVKDQSLTTFDVSTFLGVDVVDGTLTGADIANSSLTGDELVNESVTNGDILDGTLTATDIHDGFLNDEDIGESVAVDFAGQIGVLAANSCAYKDVAGLTAHGDHLLLTPSFTDAAGGLVYGARYDNTNDLVRIHVCNFTNASIDDGVTHFNLLNIDAQ
jgi:hypothetical protein